jgi:hypothetical protein
LNALIPVAVGKRISVAVGNTGETVSVAVGGTGVTVSVAVGAGVGVSVGLAVLIGVGVSVFGHCTVTVGKLQATIVPIKNRLNRTIGWSVVFE